MAAFYSFLVVLALIVIPWLGAGMGMGALFGIVLPYIAIIIFMVGFVSRIVEWAKIPVPFCIPTTAGQQKSLPWIKCNPWDNPSTKFGVFMRMVFEVLTFRSLFRNTTVKLQQDGPKVGYSSEKSLWLFALVFHYCFLVILLRHLRFFMAPVPRPIGIAEFFDSILQIGLPVMYQTDALILVGLLFLLARRVFDGKTRYISLMQDHFPLFLLLGIVLTGVWMRYVVKVDVIAVKELAMGLVTLHPAMPKNPIDPSVYAHLTLVCALFVYFPFSKLMHMGGVFLSPTRVLPNMSRRAMWVNPWNDPTIKPHSYEAYEDDYREKMIEVGLPVDKEA
ncbi:Nitrate reductase gamma subunit [Solidesulfovibrio carbinoliphilus subsp. oakridgensis]|uniref:Nitrate reductase gamma subunit n=1 Tax=Solidesulfovibrio carbinoliphilus subsp. oakridgensis TaxID=694327 RepID=G7Q9E9_9BACT|nr:sulfate reduction electron transfer complex DsrMKJOP subunit DsrM [Solidesulfovibrio carbinoliphilus]EHJ48192.1 Nitrate reductase gamma subunit [Solidesulfovibrio carbinoliphilus subsp. oakridgensis]